MKYIKLTLSYIYKNFFHILAVCIIPAFLVSLLTNPLRIITFISKFFTEEINGYSEIFESFFNFNFIGIAKDFLSVICIILFASVGVGFIQNHMRTGKKDISKNLDYINANLLSVSVSYLAYVIIHFVIMFLLSGIMYLNFVVLGQFGVNIVLLKIIGLIVSLIMLAILIPTIILLGFNAINIELNGYGFYEGLSYTINVVTSHFKQLCVAVFIPVIFVMLILAILPEDLIFSMLANLILMMYFLTLTNVAFYDMSKIKRFDNKKYYNRTY